MRVKPYLLASAMALSLSLSAMQQHPAYAADGVYETTPMVLAQNGDNRGFLDKLFNRRGDNSGAKPVYMDKGSSRTNPYDFGRARKSADQRRPGTGSVSWEAFKKEQERYAMEVRASVQAKSDAAVAVVKRKLAAERAAEAKERQQGYSDSSGNASKSAEKKRMVYDPEKAWTYSPNRREEDSRSAPKLYNSSR